VAFGLDSKQLEIFRDPKILKKKLFFKNAKTKNEQFCFIGNQFLTQIIPSRLKKISEPSGCFGDRKLWLRSRRRVPAAIWQSEFPINKTSSSGISPAMFDHFL